MPADRQLPKPIRVAVVSDSELAAGRIAEAVREADPALRPFPLVLQSAYDRIRELHPHVALLRTGPRGFQLAGNFGKAVGGRACAVVLLTPASFPREIDLVAETGAVVHLIEPVPAQALVAAVHIAAARAEESRALRREVAALRERIAARTVVERAKGVLMSRLALNEEEAHRRLQMESRNRNRKLVDTAWHVIEADRRLSQSNRRRALGASGV